MNQSRIFVYTMATGSTGSRCSGDENLQPVDCTLETALLKQNLDIQTSEDKIFADNHHAFYC